MKEMKDNNVKPREKERRQGPPGNRERIPKRKEKGTDSVSLRNEGGRVCVVHGCYGLIAHSPF